MVEQEYLEKSEDRVLEKYEIEKHVCEELRNFSEFQDTLDMFLNNTMDIADCEFDHNKVTFRFSNALILDDKETRGATQTMAYKADGKGVYSTYQIVKVNYYNECVPLAVAKTKIAYIPSNPSDNYVVLEADTPISSLGGMYTVKIGSFKYQDYLTGTAIEAKYSFRKDIADELAINYDLLKGIVDNFANSDSEKMIGLLLEYERVMRTLTIAKGYSPTLRPLD